MKLTLKNVLPLFLLLLSCSLTTQAQVDDSHSGYNAYNLKKSLTEHFAPMKTRHIVYAIVSDRVADMIDMAGDAYTRNPTAANYKLAKANFMTFIKTLEANMEPSPKLYSKAGVMMISEFDSAITLSSFERAQSTHCPMYPFCD